MLDLKASGRELSQHITDEVDFLTSRAWLLVSSIRHDATLRLLTFVLERAPVLGHRRRFLGLVEVASHDDARRVRTEVTVHQVDSVEVKWGDFAGNDKERILIERGVHVEGRALGLISAEELRGSKLFQLSARLAFLDIELRDEERSAR